MRDLIVTTPKKEMETAAEEARRCIAAGGGHYFRNFRQVPKGLDLNSRIYYVEDGFIRGFGVVSSVTKGTAVCDTTGRDWGGGFHVFMRADSWKWIEPIPMKGFQGFRYMDPDQQVKVVGGWLDPRPERKELSK